MTATVTPTTDEIVDALCAAGLNAAPEWAVPELTVQVGDTRVLLARDFNREDGGWEAALDRDGETPGLEDGPLGDADPADVVAWIHRLIADGLTPV